MNDNLTPEQAQSELAAIQSNMDHAYYHRVRPDHQPALERVTHLQRVITGESASEDSGAGTTEVAPEADAELSSSLESEVAVDGTQDLTLGIAPPQDEPWDTDTLVVTHQVMNKLKMSWGERFHWINLARNQQGKPPCTQGGAETVLRPEWGNDYEANIARAFNYVQTQPDEFQDLLGDERLLGNHPDIIRRMYELSLRELDPEEEMQAIYKLRRHPYLDRGHPAHRAEVARLHKRRQTPSKGKPTRPQAADEDVYVII
ncbi:MAG: hypothetical protein O7C73_00260 [Nitrospirae bacterium]|nr:hypothetical protein [Acidobacteriota bacterium]MCZ6780058.1 hypothetical protein [Nitrospirota bacterium]